MKLSCAILTAVCAASISLAAPALAGSNLDAARDLVNKGNYMMASGKYPEALKIYEEARKLEPTNTVIKNNIGLVYNNWGRTLANQKKYAEALEKFNKCLEVSPGYAQARRNIALLKQMALDEGIDLDAPPEAAGAPGGDAGKLPDGGWLPGHDPKTSGAKPAEPVVSGTAAIAPKVAPVQPEAGAVLFIGGVKQTPPTDSGPAFVEPVTSPPAAVVTPPVVTPPVVPPAAPATVAPPATFVQKSVNSMYPSTPQMYPADAIHTAPPAVVTPPAPAVSAPPAVPVVSFDDQLTAVEMKIYGAKQNNLTVLQRLEKIEKDSQGQVRSGTIMERINYLKSSYGL
jgi:hypothetical protein